VPGAGIVFPLIFANVMEFTLPVGGSASFTDALARVIEACGGAVITGADVKEVSRAAESHRRALAEPDVRLAPHPAPIVRPRP
jgi:phytoene dehydrogenase-like protein